ncbi:HIT family protein [Streptococcus sp. X16XC17]|uniref:HIT family protein n=1 Tax=Streptococcus sp. X16XC17 TaxID=2316646 RepID=UPI00103F46D4|nr:HIT family protein [Streptococcus sp. X16XC17]TCD45504.1 HIT family protein [Streptococcus sp. X16XC17]
MSCIFCHHLEAEQIIYETKYFKLIFDIDPIQTGHLLIISKEHFNSITELSIDALHESIEVEVKIVNLLEEQLPISGVTIASNDKELMDDGTHFHVHLIPRKKHDGFWDLLDLNKENWDLKNFLDQLN